jgi:hypothetical protein
MKKLEEEALRADLAAVESLLASRTEEEDPIGWKHFQDRLSELSEQLTTVERQLDTTASVALFFGGRPVFGSRGIEADFGGQALQQFQTAVNTRLAELSTTVGSRGPLPLWAQGQMLLTDLARGSLGFVLEEANNVELVDSQLKSAVEDVVDLIHGLTSSDDELFEAATEDVDKRVFASVKSFIKLIDDKGATLRIVEGDRDFALQRDAIEIASQRVEDLQIDEDTISANGIIYLLPDSRRFELHASEGQILKGRIDAGILSSLIDQYGEALPGIIGSTVHVSLARRKIVARGRAPRFSFRLTGFSRERSQVSDK